MSDDVLEFKLVEQEVDEDVVASLSDALRRAKEGEIKSFIMVAQTRDTGTLTYVEGWFDKLAMVGAAGRLWHHFNNELDTEAYHEPTVPDTEEDDDA